MFQIFLMYTTFQTTNTIHFSKNAKKDCILNNIETNKQTKQYRTSTHHLSNSNESKLFAYDPCTGNAGFVQILQAFWPFKWNVYEKCDTRRNRKRRKKTHTHNTQVVIEPCTNCKRHNYKLIAFHNELLRCFLLK